jgi:hypothetical protein
MTNENSSNKPALTNDQELEIAAMAKAAYPYMSFLMQTLSGKYYKEWRASDPAHRNEREELHDKQTVLDEMGLMTQAYIQRGEDLYARLQQENSPEAKEKRRMDEQGFGLEYGKEARS